MKRLTELTNLPTIGLIVALFAAVVPLRSANAGSYVCYDSNDSGFSETGYQEGDGWSQNAHGAAQSGACYADCDAFAETSVNIYGTGSLIDASASADAWASAEMWWEWEGTGTPAGGTLDYYAKIYGGTEADGRAHKDRFMSLAGADSGAGANSGSTWSSISSVAGGMVYGQTTGSATAWVSDQQHGTAYPYYGWEWYDAESGWYLEIDDEEVIQEGTSLVSVGASASCNASSSSVAGGNEGDYPYASSYSRGTGTATVQASFP